MANERATARPRVKRIRIEFGIELEERGNVTGREEMRREL